MSTRRSNCTFHGAHFMEGPRKRNAVTNIYSIQEGLYFLTSQHKDAYVDFIEGSTMRKCPATHVF